MERQTLYPEEITEQLMFANQALSEELEAHPEIETPKDKIGFVKNNFGLNNEELKSIFQVTKENQEIDSLLLDQTFALVSLLHREIKSEHLPKLLRTKAPAWENRTIIEMMSQGETERILASYHKFFEWDYRG